MVMVWELHELSYFKRINSVFVWSLQFQSHQIWHVFSLAAAFVHYHGIMKIANYRLTQGDCVATDII